MFTINLRRISNIITIILLGFAILTTFLSFYNYGYYDGFFHLNHFVYVAYTYNIIIFASYLGLLFIKYNYLSLPIFLITYSIWDGIGILQNIYSSSGIAFPYIQWWLRFLILQWSKQSILQK